MKLRTISSYAAALRPRLRPQVFRPAPLRLLWLPVHYAVIVLGTLGIARGWLAWPLELLLALVMGASFAGLTFVGHEALHGALVRNRVVRRVVGRLGFLPFAVPPRLWEAWHNRVHHGNTNRAGADPDTYPTLAEYRTSGALRRATDWLAPGRRRLAGAFSLLVGFSVQSSHMLLAAHRRGFLTRSGHVVALLEAASVWGLVALLAFALGPASFALAFLVPLLVGNTIIMSFILTNHTLNPHTAVNDPLVNSLSVSAPRFIEWLTLGFGFHVEHHLFPAVSGRYGRELASAVRREFPERYQSLPHFQALAMLHRSPRVYASDTLLVDPTSGQAWPTLLPSVPPLGARATNCLLDERCRRVTDVDRRRVGGGSAELTSAEGGGACRTDQDRTADEATTANRAPRARALALSLTVVACAGPAFRTPDDAEAPNGSGSSVLSSAGTVVQQGDAAGDVNAHRSPAATTASGLPASLTSRAEVPEDASIVERIHAVLRSERTISADTRVEVVSRGGYVLLSGRVRSDAERDAIENAVQAVAGVVRVDSRLTVAAP